MANLLEAITYGIPGLIESRKARADYESKQADRALKQQDLDLKQREMRMRELEFANILQQRQTQQENIEKIKSLLPEFGPSETFQMPEAAVGQSLGVDVGPAPPSVQLPGQPIPENRLIRAMIGAYPKEAIETLGLKPGGEWKEVGGALYNMRTGEWKRPPMDPALDAYLRNRGGPMPPGAAPSPGTTFPVSPVPSSTPPAPAHIGGISTVPKESITFTPQGPRLSLTEEPVRHVVQHEPVWDPKTNSATIYEIVTNPFTLRQTRSVVGEGVPPAAIITFEAEDAGRQPGDESLPSRRLGRRSRAGFLIC